MKTSALILAASLIFSGAANATALASVYNGQQFRLEGHLLVQDAEHPNDYYVVPKLYRLRNKVYVNDQTGESSNRASINHKVITVNGHQFSSYTMRFRLDEPGMMEKMTAEALLQLKAGRAAKIKGVAPVCGIRLATPGFDQIKPSGNQPASNPKSTTITYSISSTEAGKCNAFLDTTDFSVEYRVPMELEPKTAADLTSDTGLVLPPVELLLPYKYKDSVVVEVDAESAVKQLKAGADLQGSFKYVTAQVSANISKLVNKLSVSGGIKVDCQNPDRTICDHFLEQAKDILAKTLYIYEPFAKDGDTNPLVVADKDNASASMFKVSLGYDEQEAKRIGKFRVDFSNTVYSSISSQAQLRAAKASPAALDPIVRKKLEEQKD